MLLTVIILAASFSAHAIEVYNCDVTADAKVRDPYSFTKKMFISKDFTNVIDFGETDLKLTVRNGKLSGLVNGQTNFILRGTPESGSFESAYHVGSVSCSKSVTTSYMLQFKPWKQYYTLDKDLSDGHIHNSVTAINLYMKHICFIGDSDAAAAAISSRRILTKVIDAYQIEVNFEYNRCVPGAGSGSYDDYECAEYEVLRVKSKVINCNGDGTGDPRS